MGARELGKDSRDAGLVLVALQLGKSGMGSGEDGTGAYDDLLRELDQLGIAAWCVDSGHMVVVCNKEAATQYEYTSEEVVGTEIVGMVLEMDRGEMKGAVEASIEGKECEGCEIAMVTKNGVEVAVMMSTKPLEGGQGGAVAVVMAKGASPGEVCVKVDGNGVVVLCPRRAAEAFGKDSASVVGTALAELMVPGSRDAVGSAIQGAVEGNACTGVEVALQEGDGGERGAEMGARELGKDSRDAGLVLVALQLEQVSL